MANHTRRHAYILIMIALSGIVPVHRKGPTKSIPVMLNGGEGLTCSGGSLPIC